MKVIINLVIIFLVIQTLLFSCNLSPKANIEFPEDQMLTEHEIRFTAQQAAKLIVERKYNELRELFAPEISEEISNEEMTELVDQISSFLAKQGIPEDTNIFLSLNFVPDNGDTLFVNNIVYTFDNPAHDRNSYPRVIFVFSKKYGSSKLAGIHIQKLKENKDMIEATADTTNLSFFLSGVRKNEQIDKDLRQQIHELNDKFFTAIKTGDSTLLLELMSPKAIEKSGNKINKFISENDSVQWSDNYSVSNEYHYVKYLGTSDPSRFPITIPGENGYIIKYVSNNNEEYISLLLANAVNNEMLLILVYSKYNDRWKLDIVNLSVSKYLGKTPFELFTLAKENYNKSYLIDAVNYSLLFYERIQKTRGFLQYNKESEMKTFYDKVTKEANKKYHLPLVIETIDSKPKIFGIYPEIAHGFFPIVHYISTIDLNDTVALKIENEKIKKEIGNIFFGLDKDKEYVYYRAYNEMPDGKKLVHVYGFIDHKKDSKKITISQSSSTSDTQIQR